MRRGGTLSALAQAEFVAKLQALCRERRIDLPAAALQHSLLNPDIDITLNGIKRDDNLSATLAAMRSPLYPEQWAEIERLRREFSYLHLQDEPYYP